MKSLIGRIYRYLDVSAPLSPEPLQTVNCRSYPILCTVILFALGLIAAFTPSGDVYATETVRAISDAESNSVVATGPEVGTTLEDRVEIMWTTENTVPITSFFHISRNDTLIAVAASSTFIYEDLTALPGVTYEYCVSLVGADTIELGCDEGSRVIAAPTRFDASDGLFEKQILVSWSDRSEIEGGFNLYRDAGNALQFDGANDYVQTDGITTLDRSFTFEFWLRRASTNTDDIIVNVESNPNGDPVNVDLEVGFNAAGNFHFTFGTNALVTANTYKETDWHHWVIAYDSPNLRRFIYRDGVRIATDVLPSTFRPSGVLEFGRREAQGSPRIRGHFDGEVDEIRYWNFAFTEDEAAERKSMLLSGDEYGLMSYWPMDVANGLVAPDAVGGRNGTLINMNPADWVPTGVPEFRGEIAANLTAYADRVAVTGFQSYHYRIAAFEDINRDGAYTPAADFESVISSIQMDDGWRAVLTPPGDVSASDGQYNDRVVVNWVDLSDSEANYRIYRDGTLVGTVGADETSFTYLTGATPGNTYCVAGYANGVESVRMCDRGRAGGLAPPADVAATDNDYDDRVSITWSDTTDTEDGFRIFRDDLLLATLDADTEEYNDFSATQDVAYNYCVGAFSEADPLDPAYSDTTCAPSPGRRAIVLEPTDLTATRNDFEDRVELEWQNPSTTVMLFMVYRDGSLIQVLDFNSTRATDTGIASDTDFEYCVTAGTVVTAGSKTLLQGQVAQILQTIRQEDAARMATGGVPTPVTAVMERVYETLGVERPETPGIESLKKPGVESILTQSANETSIDGAMSFYQSAPVCETGSRSLAAPTAVDATDNEFENHVQVSWADNSLVEAGYLVYRRSDEINAGLPVLLDSLSADRTTFGDYTGTPGIEFMYTVEAFDAYDVSKPDSNLGIRTLEPPTRLTASDGTSETIVKLDWKDNSAAEDGYRIYRRIDGGARVLVDSTGTNEPAYEDTVPDNLLGVRFEYEVVAFDAFGESLEASDDGFTFIEAPVNVNASDVYTDAVVVVWVDVSGVEDNYRLTRRKIGERTLGLDILLDDRSTMYVDQGSGLDSGIEYEYCIEARLNSNGGAILSEKTCDIGALFTSSTGGGNGEPTLEPRNIVDSSPSSNFGQSVAMSEDSVAIVGAPGADDFGVANIYSVDPTNVWTKTDSLVPSDGAAFGYAVDIHGDYAVVGDPLKGRFSVWKFDTSWSKVIENFVDPGATRQTSLSFSVANVDSFVLVGDSEYDNGPQKPQGGAFVCNVKADPGCSSWIDLESILPSTTGPNAEFGYSVDITRDSTNGGDSLYVIVGAPGSQKAYVFECELTSASACTNTSDWSYDQLRNPFIANYRFGEAVAIDKALAVVGAPGSPGIAVYERTGKAEWDQRQVLSGTAVPETASTANFGSSLALRNSMIVVGASEENISDRANAGAAYVYSWTNELALVVRYDARVAGSIRANARFGESVDIGPGFYLVGEPGYNSVYSIPFGTPEPEDPIPPPDVTLAIPTGVAASDGTTPDRIQLRWNDEAEKEEGYFVYRSKEGGEFERLAEVAANIEFYDDFTAVAGDAYTYCVSAFVTGTGETIETERVCDIGWRPANGTIAGRVAVPNGAGTDEADVCLVPDPNRGLMFDGVGGYVEAVISPNDDGIDRLSLEKDFTIEAWIRPQETTGIRYIVARDSAYILAVFDGDLQFTVVELPADTTTFDAGVALQIGAWYHVAVVRKDNDVIFYLDGNPVSKTTGGALARGGGRDTLSIGQSIEYLETDEGWFEGEIDEVRIWSTARDSAQIHDARFTALSGKEEGLVGYWPLNQGLQLVVPDVTASANHGRLRNGIYLTDEGAELRVCAVTGSDGNYTISRIRYGESTEFSVIPMRPGREFLPSFKKITLSRDNPVQNEVFFSDVTAYDVSGFVRYQDIVGIDTLACPVPDVVIHVAKDKIASEDNVKDVSGADGGYAVAVDPSVDDNDTWFFIPKYEDPTDGELVHTFSPAFAEIPVTGPVSKLDFLDEKRHTLSGHFTGGNPESCAQNIGTATILIRTEDGCYNRTLTVHSGFAAGPLGNDEFDSGYFSVDLPPLPYLVEVVDVKGAPADRAEDIADFFDKLGAVEVDLTSGDVERNLIYRAPLSLRIASYPSGVEWGENSACTAINQVEDGVVIRSLPSVPIIPEFGGEALEISVIEDYGDDNFCKVEEGTVTIYDAISDRVDVDSTLTLGVDSVYVVIGASPNIYSGARIQGIDRSFQKPITMVAQVEGRPSLMETRWAIVEGSRERSATFVSATTEEFPLLMLHDPPGSNSYAFIEEGNTVCNRISNTWLIGGGAGPDIDVLLGFKAGTGFSFGAHFESDFGVGAVLRTRTIFGADHRSLNECLTLEDILGSGLPPEVGAIELPSSPFCGPSLEVCMTTTETFSTSSDPTWVGEDIHVGVALNLIFAIADVLEESNACELTLSETLAADLDNSDPFETAYMFGESHIRLSLIPELEHLIKIAGDATLTGDIEGNEQSIRLQAALDNWKRQLEVNDELTTQGIEKSSENRSFSAGTEFTHVESKDTTSVTFFESTRFYIDSENTVGVLTTAAYDQQFALGFDIRAEWNREEQDTESSSRRIGYVLSDGDTGDYFSVDIGQNPRYGTPVFQTRSGRSSNPWEANTQKRDNPIIFVDPPVLHNVDPEGAGNFQLTLINGSESNERRQYTLAVPGETNRQNLGVTVTGDLLGGQRLETFLLDPGKAFTINMDVLRVSPPFAYRDVGVILYPQEEYDIWHADPRQDFALSDTAFFSVFFDSTGSRVQMSVLAQGWNWVSTNRPASDIATAFDQVRFDHGDLIRDRYHASRYDSTRGWIGDLTDIEPGVGYWLKVQRPIYFRLTGEPVTSTEPITMKPGWNWIGYLPTRSTHIGEALESLGKTVMEGDAVVGQHGFAQYLNSIGWVGTLTDMVPGEGYALYTENGGQLLYPLEPTNEGRPVMEPRETTVRGPDWQVVPEDFTTSMTVVAEIRNNGQPLEQTTTKIAVFADDEIRGIGEVHYIEGLGRHLVFIQVYGDFEEERDMVIHVFDGETEVLYEDVATISYSAQQMLGQPSRPAVLDLAKAGMAPQLLNQPEEFALYPNYPNPFNQTTTIRYDLPETSRVTLIVYDIIGRQVMKLVDEEQVAGRHRAFFDARSYASGVYFYRLYADDFREVGKMTLVR